MTETEQMSESRAARKEAQNLVGTLHSQLSTLQASIEGRHFGDDQQAKIDALRGSVEAAEGVKETATSLVAALERALVAKSA